MATTASRLGRPGLLAAMLLAAGAARAQDAAPRLSIAPEFVPSLDAPSLAPAGPRDAPVRLSPFLDPTFGAAPPPPATGPQVRAWTVTPYIAARAFLTDNALGGGNRKRAEAILSVSPGITVQADSARVTGRATYAPSFVGYARDSDRSRISHRFLGSGLLTVLPGSVFVQATGAASVQPVSGGFLGGQAGDLPRGDQSQIYTFSLSPYWIQRLGTRASTVAGYVLQFSERTGQAVSAAPGARPFFQPNRLIGHTGYAAIRTGEDLGRVAAEARVRGTTYSGTGAIDGSQRALAVIEARYAVSRSFAVVADGGYETFRYNSVPRYEFSEPVWGVGFRWEPGPNTLVIARYRRRDGATAPSLEARVGLGPRTTAFARYEDGIGSALQNNADLLQSLRLDDRGQPVDGLTGAPRPDAASGGGGLLPLQSGLFRTRRGSASVSHFLARDTLTLAYGYTDRQVVANDRGTQAFDQTSHTLSLSWSRPLNESTVFVGTASVGTFENGGRPGSGRGESWLGRAALQRSFSETLSGSLEYQVTNRATSLGDVARPFATPRNQVQNAIILTLNKRF